MAAFKRIFNNDFYFRDEYLVEGIINDEDINWINSIQGKRIKLRFNNTKNLNSQIVSRIQNDNVVFSIDGRDERNKENRKEITPFGLASVLYYFESIESELDSSWTNIQKAMYIYNVLSTDFEYVNKIDEKLSTNDLCRSLTGILYGKLTCAGFATVFQEFMDRLGINCYYEGVEGVHRYNIIEDNGKYYGLDVTWDNVKDKNQNICNFKYFGTDPRFYYHYGHLAGSFAHLLTDIEIKELNEKYGLNVKKGSYSSRSLETIPFEIDYETNYKKIIENSIIQDISIYDKYKGEYFIPNFSENRFPLSLFTEEDIAMNLRVIKDRFNSRYHNTFDLSLEDEKIRRKFLPTYFDYDPVYDNDRESEYKSVLEIKELFAMISMLEGYDIHDDKYDVFKKLFVGKRNVALDYDNKKVEKLDINGLKFEKTFINDNWAYIGLNEEDSLPLVLKAKKDIDEKIQKYYQSVIDRVVDNLDNLLIEYEDMESLNDDRIEIQLKRALVFSDFAPFVYYEDELLKLNYRIEDAKKVSRFLKEKFKPREYSIQEKKEMDIDFLSSVFEDLNEIKKLFEEYENSPITEEDFLIKLRDINYLKKAFDLSEFCLSDEDYLSLIENSIQKQNVL